MTKIAVWGVGGKMGKIVADQCINDKDLEFVFGVDKFAQPENFKYKIVNNADANDLSQRVDVIIDFSRPEALQEILAFAKANKTPLVLATTGYSDAEQKQIDEYSKIAPVFMSYNMSLGINLLCNLVKEASKFLGEAYDIEIIEKHHNQKVDSPSGTAIMIANAINETFNNEKELCFGRHSKQDKRETKDIGIHAIRGGTIVGEHEVMFCGNNEIITISHSAQSREILASGAVRASKFIAKQNALSKKGIFNMQSMLNA